MQVHFFLNTFDFVILGLQALGIFWLGYRFQIKDTMLVVQSWALAALFYLIVATLINGITIQ